MPESALELLRKYRFKKTTNGTSTTNSSGNTSSDSSNNELTSKNNLNSESYQLLSGRKRIHVQLDSSDDSVPSVNDLPHSSFENSGNITVSEKEQRIIKLVEAAPEYHTLECQDALLQSSWNVDRALEYLKRCTVKKPRMEYFDKYENTSTSSTDQPKKNPYTIYNSTVQPTASTSAINRPSTITSQNTQYSNGSAGSSGGASNVVSGHYLNKTRQIPRKQNFPTSGNDSEDDDTSKPKECVFDSDDDDSDTEYQSEYMTKDRRNVFNFLNTATAIELQSIKTCLNKKVDAILELRPFLNWSDLVRKMQTHKNLSSDVLNFCQDLLIRRNNMMKILKKCKKLVQRLETAIPAGSGVIQQPNLLNHNLTLTDYQLVGLNWLVVMFNEKMNGILADEMGLGKTIQVIAFLAYLKETNQSTSTHLIVVPSSTLDNWEQEIYRWCPTLAVVKYHGSAEDRRILRIELNRNSYQNVDIILTTYHIINSTPEERKMFRVIKVHYVIFDEAHMLKNMISQRYTQLTRINAECRLLLTGTPLQNNLLELMSLLCFVMPSLFSPVADDIKSLFQRNSAIKKTTSPETGELNTFEQTQIEQAKNVMKPFVLRRMKKDVLNNLPVKTDIVQTIPLSETQKEKYKELVEWHSSDTGIVKATNDKSGMSIMMDMRKLSNHPLLLRYYYSDETVYQMAMSLSENPLYKKRSSHPQHIFEELAILSDFQLYQILEKYEIMGINIPDQLILNSGKFQYLDRLLPELKSNGHRVLIFSQFTMMLDILERYLDIQGHSFLRFDGQTPVNERQLLIDQYTNDKDLFVFLLSTKAGGLGINLTAADTVILHDIDFNPYNDRQAEDRCHRMGQMKPVTIYHLIAEGTIEEGMLHVAREKLNLEKEISNDDDNDVQEEKCVVRLLTMALGMDKDRAENMISPKKS